MSSANQNVGPWTQRQGQYLAFIYAYTVLHAQAPAERDVQRFFRCTAPSVHSMLKTLERQGFIRRQPGIPRSTELLIPPEQLPVLYPPE